MTEKHNVPASSLVELKKIIAGYASEDSPMSLADASKKTGMHKTRISANSKFLVELGMIHGGASKQATDNGRKYSRAVEFKKNEIERSILANSVKQNEFLSSLVTTVRIQQGMGVEEFAKHVLFAAEQANTPQNRTGARTIADLLVEAGMLDKVDNKLTVAKTQSSDVVEDENTGEQPPPAVDPAETSASSPSETRTDNGKRNLQPSVTINISLQIPDVDDPDVYDRFFKAMKNNLFPDD